MRVGNRGWLFSAVAALLITSSASVADADLQGIGEGSFSVKANRKGGIGQGSVAVTLRSSSLTAEENGEGILVFETDLSQLDAGLYTAQMRSKIEINLYPTASLEVARGALTLPVDEQTVSATVIANLTFHGRTRPVRVAYKVRRGNSGYLFLPSFSFDYTTFGIQKICSLGACVEPTVEVSAPELKARDL